MTQDGFDGAERVSATLDALTVALFDERATHYPVGSLTGWRRAGHPSAPALFGLRLGPSGFGVLTVRGLGTVVAGSTARRPSALTGAVAELVARYGGDSVRGAAVAGGLTAERFQLPVGTESADVKLRPAFPAGLTDAAGEVSPEELATGSGVEIRLALPPVFQAVTAQRAEQLAETADEVFAGGTVQARQDWAVLSALLSEDCAAAGVVFAGVAAVEVEDRPSRASLVVSLRPGRADAETVAAERPQAEIRTVQLPAGPAVVLVEARTSPVPAALTADGQRRWSIRSVAEALVPLPDGESLLTVQLGTAQAEDWELYAEAFAEIMRSVQLGWDGQTAASAVQAPAEPVTEPVAEPVAETVTPAVPPMPNEPPARPEPTVPAPTVPAPSTQEPPLQGLGVNVPPPEFDPFKQQTATQPAATELDDAPDPFAEPTTSATRASGTELDSVGGSSAEPTAPAVEDPAAPKGRLVNVPPPDFNPFAPPAPAKEQPAAAEQDPESLKGRLVNVPPPDFNPFGASSAPSTPSAPAPAQPAVQAPAAKPDPFGTVVPEQKPDPFGTVTKDTRPAAPVPPKPTTPPPTNDQPDPLKGRLVNVPPADFNPFAPPAPAKEQSAEEEQESLKGRLVNVPPPDFNPFGMAAPAAETPAAPSTPEPPANNPFG